MNKKQLTYTVAWLVLVAIFNIIVFVVPVADGYEKYLGAFWGAYVFAMLAFVGQLICSLVALKEDDKQKLFYNIPLIRISYSTLILAIIISSTCFLIPDFPNWIAVVACVIVLGFMIITVIKAKSGADVVANIDNKVKEQTLFIKMLRNDVELLASKTGVGEMTEHINKVVDVVRYSDPMTNNALSSVESQITLKFAELSKSVEEKNVDAVKALVDEMLVLIEDRNKKCRILK